MILSSLPPNVAGQFLASPSVGQSVSEPRSDLGLNSSSFKPVNTLESSDRSSSQLKGRQPQQALSTSDRDALSLRDRESPGTSSPKENTQGDDDQKRLEEAREKQALLEIQRQVRELASRDREVRAHEQAHAAVGGQYAGAPSYEFERGPDGVRYAVGGEVPISTSKEPTPQETLQKAQIVRRAALAPVDPSPQDRRVAAQASRMETEARAEIAAERAERLREKQDRDETNRAEDSNTGNRSEGVEESNDTAQNSVASRPAPEIPPASRFAEASVGISSRPVSPPNSAFASVLTLSQPLQTPRPGDLLDAIV